MADETNTATLEAPEAAPTQVDDGYMERISGTAGQESLDGIFSRSPEKPQPKEIVEEAGQATADEPVVEAETPELDPSLKELAAETGLDLSDPAQVQAFNALLKNDKFTEYLTSKQAKSEQPQPGELLTEFEKSLQAPAAETKAAEPAVAKEPEKPAQDPNQPMQFNDIGDGWKEPKDSYEAENQAWTENDLGKLHAIRSAQQVRYVHGMVIPAVRQLLQQEFQRLGLTDVGKILPAVREDYQERRSADNRNAAIDDVLKLPGHDVLAKMLEKEEGDPVTMGGAQYPNTPINRLFAEFPEILDIRVDHKDPDVAQRLTWNKRFKAAVRTYNLKANQGMKPETATKLVEAGKAIKNRSDSDRARQTINSGSPATTRGTKSSPDDEYINRITNTADSLSVADLMTRRR